MKPSAFDKLIHTLIGAAWALTAIIAYIGYFLFSHQGLFVGLIAAFIFSFIGLFFVIVLEYMLLKSQSEKEQHKQTQLLQEILSKINS